MTAITPITIETHALERLPYLQALTVIRHKAVLDRTKEYLIICDPCYHRDARDHAVIVKPLLDDVHEIVVVDSRAKENPRLVHPLKTTRVLNANGENPKTRDVNG